jgi:hypothetical protein
MKLFCGACPQGNAVADFYVLKMWVWLFVVPPSGGSTASKTALMRDYEL